jgi:hypothetical protein
MARGLRGIPGQPEPPPARDGRLVPVHGAGNASGTSARADLGDLGHHDLCALEWQDFDNGPRRRMDIVRARSRERFPCPDRVEPGSGPESRPLVQPEDHRAAGAVAERAEGFASDFGSFPTADFTPIECVSAPTERSSATRRFSSSLSTGTSSPRADVGARTADAALHHAPDISPPSTYCVMRLTVD